VADLLTRAISLDVSKELKSKENSEIVKKNPQLLKEKTQDFGQFPKELLNICSINLNKETKKLANLQSLIALEGFSL